MKTFLIAACLTLLAFPPGGMAQTDANFRNFTVTQSDQTVRIFFTLVGGVTCSGVKVERSSDGVSYSLVEEIEGVCGSPLTDASYQVVDKMPLYNRIVYYRINLESLHTTSLPVSFRYIDYQAEAVSIFPNPCMNGCDVYFPNPNRLKYQVTVHNSAGQRVYNNMTDAHSVYIKSSGFSRGNYMISISYNDAIRYRGTVVIP